MHSNTATFSRYLETAGVAGCAVKKGTASNGVTAITSTSDKPAGLLTESKDAAAIAQDAQAGIVVSGMAVGLAGAAVEIDDDLQADATGKLVPKSAAGWVVGKAKTKAANGEYFEILVNIRKEPA